MTNAKWEGEKNTTSKCHTIVEGLETVTTQSAFFFCFNSADLIILCCAFIYSNRHNMQTCSGEYMFNHIIEDILQYFNCIWPI